MTDGRDHAVWVDRKRALFGAWYEFFPRSEGARARRAGRPAQRHFPHRDGAPARRRRDGLRRRLPAADPPDRPGQPQGPQQHPDPRRQPTTPARPWAIGSDEGGHDAIHPDLGTIEDFDAFVARDRASSAWRSRSTSRCSARPTTRGSTEHPEWFTTRADGTIAYAENPPKKYQDIYPLNFDNDPEGLYAEVLRVVRHWIDHGVKIFRVDNPHTKPLEFWEWLIAEVKATDPDVLFLAEAFTRPAMMHELAEVGFTPVLHVLHLAHRQAGAAGLRRASSSTPADYMRPNFFVNTPDILHASLQYGGPPMFKIRAVLAALLSPTYGVYAGYELYEHVAVEPGSEEYLDSEKYQYSPRDWSHAGADAGAVPHDAQPRAAASTRRCSGCAT